MEMKVVYYTICSHTVVANPEFRFVRDLKNLNHEKQQLIRQNLRQPFLSKEKNERVVFADRVLVKQDWMQF